MKSSSLYEPIYTIHTYMISRVWAVRATWMSYDVIARDWAIHTYTHTWASRGEPYELIIRQDHLQYKTYRDVCRVWAICYSLSTHMIHVFRGWAMGYKWASSWSVWRVQNYDTDRDQRVAQCLTGARSLLLHQSVVLSDCCLEQRTLNRLTKSWQNTMDRTLADWYFYLFIFNPIFYLSPFFSLSLVHIFSRN